MHNNNHIHVDQVDKIVEKHLLLNMIIVIIKGKIVIKINLNIKSKVNKELDKDLIKIMMIGLSEIHY